MNNQLTHYFIFDPEALTCTSHFSDEPMPAYGPSAIICVSPLTHYSASGRRVMCWLAAQTMEDLYRIERISFGGDMPMDLRSQFVAYRLNKGYPVAMRDIVALDESMKPRATGFDEWDSLYDRAIQAAGLQDDATVGKNGGAA